MNTVDYVSEIARLKREKRAVILAHYYTYGEVQAVADFVGDSLALSERAADTDAEIILFAGVKFMAETAKVLSPSKKVLLPEPLAGCSLADSCDAAGLARLKSENPSATVISYVNTSVEVKALTDICCTSSNALRVVESLPKDEQIIFAPDRNLGDYIRRMTGRENMIVWDGACHVHEQFSVEGIVKLKEQHPSAKVLAHPECKRPLLMLADFVGSTAAILDYCGKDNCSEYIVATESGILYEMRRRYPEKSFLPAPPTDAVCACNNCMYMKMITLEKIYNALRDECPEIVIDEQIRSRAEKSIRRMLAIK